MANYTFKLPDIGEGIAEAEIVAWYVAVGDVVEEDAHLADMMTDKATVEMYAPVAGKVIGLAGEVGDQIAIGAVLVTLEVEDGASAPEPAPSAPAAVEVPPAPAPEAIAAPAPVAEDKPAAEGKDYVVYTEDKPAETADTSAE